MPISGADDGAIVGLKVDVIGDVGALDPSTATSNWRRW